jgi:cysteine protease ATG4
MSTGDVAEVLKACSRLLCTAFSELSRCHGAFPRLRAPFGIRAFCQVIFDFTRKAGKWVKTSIIAKVIEQLLKKFSISVLLSENGLISKSTLIAELAEQQPILVLVPLMLGRSELDQESIPFVKCLSMRDPSIGIIGGQQGKAFFLIGYRADTPYFLIHTLFWTPFVDQRTSRDFMSHHCDT